MKYLLIIIILLLTPLVYGKIPCYGCDFNNDCLKIGTQHLNQENGYEIYCSTEKKIEKAKEDNQACLNHYECKSYYCNNVCTSLAANQRGKAKGLLVISLILLISIMLSSIFILLKFKIIKFKPKEVKKMPTKISTSIKYPPIINKKTHKLDYLERELQKIKK